jgi:hypothetical protein
MASEGPAMASEVPAMAGEVVAGAPWAGTRPDPDRAAA